MNDVFKARCMCALIAATTVALVGCGESQDEPEATKTGEAIEPNLVGGKADSGASIFTMGELGLGEDGAQRNEFTRDGAFHAYELTVAAGAQVTLEVSQKGTTRSIDPTMYVFGPQDDDGRFGAFIGFDDDDGWGLYPRLRDLTLEEGGTYLVIIGTFNGRDRGNYRVEGVCENGACTAPEPVEDPLADACVFGEEYRDLFGGSGAVVVTSERQIARDSALTQLEREQALAAVQVAYEEATTYEKAVATVDAGVINQIQVWDASERRAFTAYEYGAGDNSYGAILFADSTALAARIADGFLYDCLAFWGPERRQCEADSDCAAGLRCNGVVNGKGACLDPQAPRPDGEGDSCTTSADCNTGLACAGEATGGGLCNPAWMKRSFMREGAALAIPDGDPQGVEITLDSFGLSSVHTDILVDLWLPHENPSDVRVTLTNPTGTEVVLFDKDPDAREIFFDDRAFVGYPGDEDANGTWTLHIVDDVPGHTGQVVEFGVTLMSRWD